MNSNNNNNNIMIWLHGYFQRKVNKNVFKVKSVTNQYNSDYKMICVLDQFCIWSKVVICPYCDYFIMLSIPFLKNVSNFQRMFNT